MRSYPIDPESFPLPTSGVREVDLSDQPVIALLYAISAVLMEILGPMFWAALILLFIHAELFTNSDGNTGWLIKVNAVQSALE
jgi:hypothetical protein